MLRPLPPQNPNGYIPEGLTPAQYEAFLNAEEAKKSAKKTRFPKGKDVETLTDWLLEQKQKGQYKVSPKHRMVKTKYDGWYKSD